MYASVEEMRDLYGFNAFDAEQTLYAGAPPDAVNVVTVRTAPAAIHNTLTTVLGYTSTTVLTGTTEATLYSLRGDYEMDLGGESVVGRLGGLNRIAVMAGPADEDAADGPTTLIIGRATPTVLAALAAHGGTAPSLAASPFHRFAVESVAGSTLGDRGSLVGLILMPPQPGDPMIELGLAGSDAVRAQVERYRQQPFPPALLNAFATFRDGDETVLVLLLVLPSDADAGAVVSLLYDRLLSYVSAATNAPLNERWGVEGQGVIGGGDLAAAYVTLRLPSGTTAPSPGAT
jgi:hypothetical protein